MMDFLIYCFFYLHLWIKAPQNSNKDKNSKTSTKPDKKVKSHEIYTAWKHFFYKIMHIIKNSHRLIHFKIHLKIHYFIVCFSCFEQFLHFLKFIFLRRSVTFYNTSNQLVVSLPDSFLFFFICSTMYLVCNIYG